MLSSLFRPSSTIRIFSSAEYCLRPSHRCCVSTAGQRVARRKSLTTSATWLLRVPLFRENASLGLFPIPPILSHFHSLVVQTRQKPSFIR